MNPRRVIVALTLALLVSGGCTWLVSRRLTAPRPPLNSAQVQYAAASRALQAGEVLNPANTELVSWPASIPIDGAFRRTADLTGRQVIFPLAKGQPIIERDLAAAGAGIGLASRVPDGMRAVALRSDEVVGVAGFLLPGSHLDVLVTYRADGSSQPLTATVLQNVIVIAAGHQTEPDPSGKTPDATLVTLLLTPDDAQRAVLASTQGTIHFVLRNGADSESTATAPVLLSQLAVFAPVAGRQVTRSSRPVTASAPVAPVRHEIETILAGDTRAVSGQGGGTGQ
jgi:pilus assembly protein CpaB